MSMEKILEAGQERINTLHKIQKDRTALLVIDMQRGFMEPGAAPEVPPGRELIPCIRRLIDCCRQVRVPVIFTEFVYSNALSCLRGNPFGPEHLPAEQDMPTGFGHPSGNCLISVGFLALRVYNHRAALQVIRQTERKHELSMSNRR